MTRFTRREFGMLVAAQLPQHTEKRSFIGQTVFAARPGVLTMIAPWGRPPLDFSAAPEWRLPPMQYESRDDGATWKEAGRLNMRWNLPGIISDGGISWNRLHDGRQMLTFHRNVPGYHGGGAPAVSFSRDQGASWSDPALVTKQEHVYYLMNDRTVQLVSGRLVIPVALRPERSSERYVEGEICWAACFLSDDGGANWRRGGLVELNDQRGMAEPAVAETRDGGLVMLARTGSGCHYLSRSKDGGNTWSVPEPTPLRAACSPLTLTRMPGGGLLVAYNHATALRPGAFFPRTPLCYATSQDEGRTWSDPFAVQAGDGRQWIYPSVTFLKKQVLFTFSEHVDPGDGGFRQSDGAWKIGGARTVRLPLPAKAALALPPLPVPLAGHFAGVYNGALIVAGGTTWTRPRWEGGEKRWVRPIWMLLPGKSAWRQAGEMPEDLAYGVSVSGPDGLYCFGGQSAQGVSRRVVQISVLHDTATVKTVGELPAPRANWAGVNVGGAVYLFGGQARTDGPGENQLWRWSGETTEVLPPLPGPGRILPSVIEGAGGIEVLSGAEPGPPRVYLRDRWAFHPDRGWQRKADLPRATVAATTLRTSQGRSLLFGGDDGRLAAEAVQLAALHPGFSCDVIDVTDGWQPVAAMRCGLVTTQAVHWNGRIVVPGGEDRPGTRSAQVISVEAP